MTTSLGATPTATAYEVEDLVNLVRRGDLRIPEFQRPLRWGQRDAQRLFDSILRGYPVGSLLLWARPAEAARLRLGALDIDAPSKERALWVVDGQQRVTTLANVLTDSGAAQEQFALDFNLVSGEIVPSHSARAPAIPLPVLFDLQRLLSWFRDHPEFERYFDLASRTTSKLRQYKIPVSIVDSADEAVLRDIFDRLNSYGKRLTRAEVFSALHPAASGESPPTSDSIETIAAFVDEDLQFGVVDGDTILRAVLARRGSDITREIRGEFDNDRRGVIEFPHETPEVAYREAQNAIRASIEFLQSRAEVPHFALLPYRHLLIVLTRFFAHHPNLGSRDLFLLRRWFWRAAGAGPSLFPGSTTGTARALCSRVIPGDLNASLQGLLDAIPETKVGFPDVRNFRTNHASGKMICCVLWALHPRSLRSGDRVGVGDLVTALGDAQTPRPAMTPVVSRHDVPPDYANSAARWLMVPGLEAAPSEVPAILGSDPLDVPEESWRATLESHALDDDARLLLSSGDATRFVQTRQTLLEIKVKTFFTSRWEFGFEDTPSLDSFIVDDLEVGEDADA